MANIMDRVRRYSSATVPFYVAIPAQASHARAKFTSHSNIGGLIGIEEQASVRNLLIDRRYV